MQNEKWEKTTNDDTNHNAKGKANAADTERERKRKKREREVEKERQVQRTSNVAWQMQLSSNDLIRRQGHDETR